MNTIHDIKNPIIGSICIIDEIENTKNPNETEDDT